MEDPNGVAKAGREVRVGHQSQAIHAVEGSSLQEGFPLLQFAASRRHLPGGGAGEGGHGMLQNTKPPASHIAWIAAGKSPFGTSHRVCAVLGLVCHGQMGQEELSCCTFADGEMDMHRLGMRTCQYM